MRRPQHPELPFEQAQNAQYLKRLKAWLEKPVQYGIAASQKWVAPNPNGHGKSYGVMHPLIGRVGLTVGEELFDGAKHFYIGVRRLPGDMSKGIPETISWLSPAAQAFFNPDHPDSGYFGQIAAIRTFTESVDEIIAVDEEWFQEVASSPFEGEALSVPAPAASRPTRRRRTSAAPKPTVALADDAETPAESPESSTMPDEASLSGMRGAGAVLDRLAAPRRSELSPVIATLQPDQHRLVTLAADRDAIIQGHPGTGKTVVAAYRAGFLITPRGFADNVSDAHGAELGGGCQRVLLVGPTKGYARHVAGLLRPFERPDAGTVTVTDIRTFMADRVGIKSSWSGFYDGHRDAVDDLIPQLCRSAAADVRLLKAYSGEKADLRRDLHLTYEALRNPVDPNAIDSDRLDVRQWRMQLPEFEVAASKRRFLPLLALCRLALRGPTANEIYDHIITDEAQDLGTLEWDVLAAHLHPLRGHWTLVGDQNQRRTTIGYSSWAGIAQHLQLNGDGQCTHEVMTRGYRSTSSILAFADGLLAPSLRKAASIQPSGDDVHVIYERKSKRLFATVVETAEELVLKHIDGQVAVICTTPDDVKDHLLKTGWRKNRTDFRTFERDGFTLQLFSPAMARGLEFDAVVVVEPRRYANDNGRHGQLYTSLTRANRELAVVHSGRLPKGLKAPDKPA